MAVLDTTSDFDATETSVLVHSPVIQNSKKGAYYTSYAVSLETNDPSFTLCQSCVRRRYSEFVHLRRLLKSHHPNIEPPVLPPRNYFGRFDATFVSHRAGGLEDFLKKIIEVPVYLSNKGVHLFLQTYTPMSQIDKLVSDKVPASQIIESQPYVAALEESNSSSASPGCCEYHPSDKDVREELVIVPKDISDECDSVSPPHRMPTVCSTPIPITKRKMHNCIYTARRISPIIGSCLSNCSEHTSNGNSPDSTHSSPRRVSFNEKVTVAVIGDHFKNIAVMPIKTGVC